MKRFVRTIALFFCLCINVEATVGNVRYSRALRATTLPPSTGIKLLVNTTVTAVESNVAFVKYCNGSCTSVLFNVGFTATSNLEHHQSFPNQVVTVDAAATTWNTPINYQVTFFQQPTAAIFLKLTVKATPAGVDKPMTVCDSQPMLTLLNGSVSTGSAIVTCTQQDRSLKMTFDFSYRCLTGSYWSINCQFCRRSDTTDQCYECNETTAQRICCVGFNPANSCYKNGYESSVTAITATTPVGGGTTSTGSIITTTTASDTIQAWIDNNRTLFFWIMVGLALLALLLLILLCICCCCCIRYYRRGKKKQKVAPAAPRPPSGLYYQQPPTARKEISTSTSASLDIYHLPSAPSMIHYAEMRDSPVNEWPTNRGGVPHRRAPTPPAIGRAATPPIGTAVTLNRRTDLQPLSAIRHRHSFSQSSTSSGREIDRILRRKKSLPNGETPVYSLPTKSVAKPTSRPTNLDLVEPGYAVYDSFRNSRPKGDPPPYGAPVISSRPVAYV